MLVKRKSLVLSVSKPYNFIPEGETEPLVGCKMFYVNAENIAETIVDEETGGLGYFPQKETMTPDLYDKAVAVGLPCYATFTLDIKTTAKGYDVDIKDVEFLKPNAK